VGGGHTKRALARLPTLNPFGLRGCEGDRDKRKARDKGDPALRDPNSAARLRAVSDWPPLS